MTVRHSEEMSRGGRDAQIQREVRVAEGLPCAGFTYENTVTPEPCSEEPACEAAGHSPGWRQRFGTIEQGGQLKLWERPKDRILENEKSQGSKG